MSEESAAKSDPEESVTRKSDPEKRQLPGKAILKRVSCRIIDPEKDF